MSTTLSFFTSGVICICICVCIHVYACMAITLQLTGCLTEGTPFHPRGTSRRSLLCRVPPAEGSTHLPSGQDGLPRKLATESATTDNFIFV